MTDPQEDDWAVYLMVRTPKDQAPEIAHLHPWGQWKETPLEVRQFFRARVRRLMDHGDTGVIPMVDSPTLR